MLSASASADTIGVYLGGSVWDNSVSGTLGEKTGQADLGLKDETQTSFFVAVEHPFPLIPNLRISADELDTTGSTLLTESFEFGGETYAPGTALDTTFDVNYMDYTLYYELFDNGLFSFDLGFTARDFDSDILVSNTVESGEGEDPTVTTSTVSASEWVPMVYVASSASLPLTGLSIYAQGNLLSLSDHILYDYEAGVSYALIDNFAIDLNLTLGYKAVRLELEDMDGLYSDLDFDGVYAGAVVHF